MTDRRAAFLEETRQHIARVQALLGIVARELQHRGEVHDASKLVEPELSGFAGETAHLSGVAYTSPEYAAALERMSAAVEHHYRENRHHPQHWFAPETEAVTALRADIAALRAYPVQSPVIQRAIAHLEERLAWELSGVGQMSLIDLMELLADWKAAGEQTARGSLAESLRYNRTRFKIPNALYTVLERTARDLGWIDEETA